MYNNKIQQQLIRPIFQNEIHVEGKPYLPIQHGTHEAVAEQAPASVKISHLVAGSKPDFAAKIKLHVC